MSGHEPLARFEWNRKAVSGGGIVRNGVVLFPNDVFTLEGDYHFVDFQQQQSIV